MELYKNSLKVSKRITGILYYDCTNYFFELEQENGLKQYGPSKEQKLIVTYSIKYRNYQCQIERAKYAIENKSIKLDKCNQNNYKRFVNKTNITKDGEIAEKKVLSLNTNKIEKEEKFDGFYGVCTNLEDNAEATLVYLFKVFIS